VADAIVDIDTDLCLGSGYCERSLPQVFRMVDGTAQVRDRSTPVTDDLGDRLDAAAMGCPAAAITVHHR